MYSKLYISFIFVVMVFTTFKLLAKGGRHKDGKLPTVLPLKTILLGFIVVIFITFFPADYGSDKERYVDMFLSSDIEKLSHDYGWMYYNKFVKYFFDSSIIFFFITAFIYVGSYYFFLKQHIKTAYLFYILLAFFGGLGFFAYGVNTIRAGVGLALFLCALSSRNNIKFFLFFILSILIHKSMLILFVALMITKVFTNTKFLYKIWFCFLIISIFNNSIISDFLLNNFSDFDDRVTGYVGVESNELYKAGFRLDFLIYSLIPMIVARYYLYNIKFKNDFYVRITNIYIIVNSFWLLLIRIPFTDRFAYLSWFLIPFIVLYPLFKIENLNNRHLKLAMGITAIVFVNFILYFI